MLFLNTLRGLKNRKKEVGIITFLILLSSFLYTGFNVALDRINDSYQGYLKSQNVEDVSVSIKIDYEHDISLDMLNKLNNSCFSQILESEKVILDEYYNLLLEEKKIDNDLIVLVEDIFVKYNANEVIENEILSSIKDKYNFDYIKEDYKLIRDHDNLINVLPYRDKEINKPYLLSGSIPQKEEITILKEFALKNNIKIGDSYKIFGNIYKVVGFMYAPEFIYPMLSVTTPMLDLAKTNIVYMSEDDYQRLNINNSYTYALTFKNKRNIKQNDICNISVFDHRNIKCFSDNTLRFDRINTLASELKNDRLFIKYILYLILIISFLIISIILKREIDYEKNTIGVLKVLGYNCFLIAFSYLPYSIVPSLFGSIFGTILGYAFSNKIAAFLVSDYLVPLKTFNYSYVYIKNIVIYPTIILSLFSYLLLIINLRRSALSLIKDEGSLKIGFVNKLFNRLFSLLSIEHKFKYLFTFRYPFKLLIVQFISFCVSLLILLALLGSNLFNSIIDKSFYGMNYKYVVSLNNFSSDYIGNRDLSDYVLYISLPLTCVKNSNGSIKKISDKYDFSFTAIDSNTKYIHIKNSGKDINDLLLNDGIIVNRNIFSKLNLSIGDTLVFDNKLEYKVVGVSDEYINYGVYINRDKLSFDLGFKNSMYSVIYSTDQIYDNYNNSDNRINNVLNISDIKKNAGKGVEKLNVSFAFISLFALFMSFIIMLSISNIIVLENKKIIALMKVMGYNKKKIKDIVLNIYTPVIILSYFLAIPFTINFLRYFMNKLDIGMLFTININITQIIIGLILVLGIYFISIMVAQKSLDKISLSVLLKRE